MANQVVDVDILAKKNIESWLQGQYDESTKQIIQNLLTESPSELIDAFYKKLSFGTGGLRGLMGVGCNRLNVYTVRSATQGLVNYIKKQPQSTQGNAVAIGYDTRHHSQLFAEETAKVLAANGIQAYLFQTFEPTPLVSFACRHKQCIAAVMITASHNPPAYNGYKVYWSDGAQVVHPHDQLIETEANLIESLEQVKSVDSLNHPLISYLDDEVVKSYLEAVKSLSLYPEYTLQDRKQLQIIYTNLHGTGLAIVPRLLTDWSFDFSVVDAQLSPDGNFPTVKSPNPEEHEALALGIQKLLAEQADILIATDPDADRLGVAVRHQGKVEILNGNQIGCLLLEHISLAWKQQKRIQANTAVVKTLATTELFRAIALSHGIHCFDVLTGFKYIAELMRQWEETPNGFQFMFGAEESLGYLLGTQTRDKDACLAAVLVCEVALKAKLQNKTLVDLLHDIYQKHGFYFEKLLAIKFEESKSGHESMQRVMRQLRQQPPSTLNDVEVLSLDCFEEGITLDLKTGLKTPFAFSHARGIRFRLADKSMVLVRPSGTEPKIKVYVSVVTNTPQEGNDNSNQLLETIKSFISH